MILIATKKGDLGRPFLLQSIIVLSVTISQRAKNRFVSLAQVVIAKIQWYS